MNGEIVTRLQHSFSEPLILPEDLLIRIARRAADRSIPVRAEILGTLDEAYPYGIGVGEFIEKWALSAAHAPSDSERERIIDRANEDVGAKAGGLALAEGVSSDGDPVIEVYHEHYPMPKTLVATLTIEIPVR